MGTMKAIFVEPAATMLSQIGWFVSNIITFLFILIIGWLVSKFIRTLTTKFLKIIKLDQIADKVELDALLEKGGIAVSLSELVGSIVYWLCLLVTFVVAVNAVGLVAAADLLNRIVLYIPNVIAGIFILILGMFVATMLRNIVFTAASNAGVTQAKLLSKAVETIVIVFALLITLEQLNIGADVIKLAISIFLGSLGLAFAIAFGFGCQEIAKKFLSELIEKTKSR